MKTALLQTVPAVIGRTENQVAALHDQEDILLLLVADARAPTFHRASVALRAYPAVERPGHLRPAPSAD